MSLCLSLLAFLFSLLHFRLGGLDGATLLFSPASFFLSSDVAAFKQKEVMHSQAASGALTAGVERAAAAAALFFITINVSGPLHPRRAFILHQWKMSNAFATVATRRRQ